MPADITIRQEGNSDACASTNALGETKAAIGFDCGRYGVAPTDHQMLFADFAKAYATARAQFEVAPRTVAAFVRLWIELRWRAAEKMLGWSAQLTPDYLRQIYPDYCPITRERLGPPGARTRLTLVTRRRGYRPGNVVFLSERAHRAFARTSHSGYMHSISRKLRTIGPAAECMELRASEWLRAAIIAAVAHSSEADAARARAWPLAAMPPGGVAIASNAWAFKLACSDLALEAGPAAVDYLCPPTVRDTFDFFAAALRAAAQRVSSRLTCRRK